MRALLALLVFFPAVAQAYECTRSDADASIPVAWPMRRVPYSVSGAIGVTLTDLTAAFGVWTEVSCSDLVLEDRGVPLNEPGITVRTLTDRPVWWEPDAVAITLTNYETATGSIRSSAIELETASNMLGDVPVDGCSQANKTFDLRAVLTHEVGHAIGLAHTLRYDGGRDDPTMAPRVEACDDSKRGLEQDDRNAICAMYPVGQAGSCRGDPVLAVLDEAPTGCSAMGAHRDGVFGGLVVLILGLRRKRS